MKGQLVAKLTRFRHFLGHDLWDLELSSIGFVRRCLYKVIRIVYLSFSGFRDDELTLRASGLTLVSLLSLAPLLAFVFTIFKGAGRGQQAIAQFKVFIATLPEQSQELMLQVVGYVEEANTVGLGGTAIVILLLAVIKLMGSIESSFNRVWGITTSRPITRKITDYIAGLILAAMVVMAAMLSGLQSNTLWVRYVAQHPWLSDSLLGLAPLGVAWVGFSVLYVFMPNTRVRFFPALVSGLVAAGMWTAWQPFYLRFQAMIFGQQDKVFGAFASVPIFLIWLFVCWVIVLFGTEVAFAIQNYATFSKEQRAHLASHESRILLGLGIVSDATRSMLAGRPCFDADAFGRGHGVPVRLMNEVIQTLVDSRWLAELAEHQSAYVLLKDPSQAKVQDLVQTFRASGVAPDALGLLSLDTHVTDAWRSAHREVDESLGSVTLKDLVAPVSREEVRNAGDPG